MKKIKYLLIVLLMAFSMLTISACNNEEPVVDDGIITLEKLQALVFEDETFAYDGQKHEIFVKNVPEGVTVKYNNNGKINPGEYTVTASLMYEKLFVKKTAKLIIEYMESVITAETEQTKFVYGHAYPLPTYSLNNTEQEVVYNVFKDGKEVSVEALANPGVYNVEIKALQSKKYAESKVDVELTIIESMFGLSFESQSIEYDGSQHKIELEGSVPTGYTVTYTENVGTEAGKYFAKAEVKDSNGNVVETHGAVLEIYNPDNAAFNEYLDMFFHEYLEGDQLSINIFLEHPENFGFEERYEAEWYTYESSTDEETTEYLEYINDLYNKLIAFEDEALSTLQGVIYRKVEDFLLETIETYKIEDIEYLNLRYVDSFGGYVADFATYMEAYSLRSELEVIDVVNYIKSTKTAFPSYLDYVEARLQNGYALSDYTITEMRVYLSNVLEDKNNYYLVDVFGEKIDKLSFLNEEQKTEYKKVISDEMKNSFMVGVQELYDGLGSYLGKLDSKDTGYLSTYENGKELYVLNLKSLLGIDDLDINAYIKEVDAAYKSAKKKSDELYDKLVTGGESLNSIMAKYPIFNGTPEEMMEYLKEFAPTIVPELKSNPDIFIKEMDDASAKASTAVAYYMKSALDNTSGENITLNPLKLENMNDTLATLAHEGYPGHLYAYVFSKEIAQHDLGKVMTSTAHAEGWATYVELKLYEYALANTKDFNTRKVIEYLKAQHETAFLLEARIDLGLHYERWGIAGLEKYLGPGYSYQSIINQFIEMPTTYNAYGYGKLYFVKLHNEAQQVLGVHYDEIEFNAMLHSRGWTDLGELKNTFNEYMQVKCHELGIEYNVK